MGRCLSPIHGSLLVALCGSWAQFSDITKVLTYSAKCVYVVRLSLFHNELQRGRKRGNTFLYFLSLRLNVIVCFLKSLFLRFESVRSTKVISIDM